MKLRKWIALCLACTMVVSLCACKGKTDGPSDKEVSSEIKEDIIEGSESGKDDVSLENTDENVSNNETDSEDTAAADSKKHEHIHLKIGKVYEHEYSDAYSTTLAHAEYPVIKLEECCEEAFEDLEDAIDDLNEDERASVRNQFWDMIDSAKEQVQGGYEYFVAHEVTEDVSVRRADAAVLSLLYDGYAYLGGAHGMEYYWSKNYDVQTGKELLLSDVVNDMSLLPGMVKAELEKYVDADALFGSYDEVAEYVAEDANSLTWVLDYSGLTLFFDPYEIGSYAAGAHTITMSFTEYPNLIKKEYQQVPERYTIQMTSYLPTYYDFNMDGVKDELSVWGMMDGDYGITNLCISMNGQQYKYEAWCYEIDPLLVHTEFGNYLYVQMTSDNDYRQISIYKMGENGLESLGYINNGWYSENVEDREYWGLQQVFTDPGQFRLETRTEVLSSVNAYKNYIVNQNGVPASADKYYYVNYPMKFTAKMPLPVELVDKNTNESVGFSTVNKGDVVTYYGTDDKNIAYLKLADDSIAKVIVDTENWPILVNGIPLEEQFDGVMFAG